MPDANRKYHDHVASIYDDIYGRSPYWRFYHEISWDHMKPFLPRDLSAEFHDAGCGTGHYGLKLLSSGFRVFFSDISPKMLDAARRKVSKEGFSAKAEFARIDITDMSKIADGRFRLVCAQGDPLSLCRYPAKALKEMSRTLAPGGVVVASVDNRVAGYEHFLEKKDLKGLQKFHKEGILTWLAEKPDERFPVRTFDPKDLVRLGRTAGLELESMIAKIVLPLRGYPELLEDKEAYKVLKRIEKKLASQEANLGRASHIQAVFRKPE
jgi:SAM-dependent methyltransferase